MQRSDQSCFQLGHHSLAFASQPSQGRKHPWHLVQTRALLKTTKQRGLHRSVGTEATLVCPLPQQGTRRMHPSASPLAPTSTLLARDLRWKLLSSRVDYGCVQMRAGEHDVQC